MAPKTAQTPGTRKPLGIIQVPVNAFEFIPGVGRDLDHGIVDNLVRLFRQVRCRPKKWDHHVEGLIDLRMYYEILFTLNLSRQQFLETAARGRAYPKVRLPPRSIVCLQGKQRLAAAKSRFGGEYFWTVRLYYPTGMCKAGRGATGLTHRRQGRLPSGRADAGISSPDKAAGWRDILDVPAL